MQVKKVDANLFSALSLHAAKSVDAALRLMETLSRIEVRDAAPSQRWGDAKHAPHMHTHALDELAHELYAAIKSAETTADAITHGKGERLHETSVTPVDRAHMHTLRGRMDDVLELIADVAAKLVLYRVSVAPREAIELARYLVESCEALACALALLNSMGRAREILELCGEVKRLESAADGAHHAAMVELLQVGNDPLQVMKWCDILDALESATGRCEDAANVIKGVVLARA